MLGGPCEVAVFETQSTELGVATSCAHTVDTLCAQLGVGGLATELELSLFAVVLLL